MTAGAPHARVVVIGGGVTGLSAAHALAAAARARRAAIACTLVEADDRLGGKVRTVRVEGCVVEGGPDSFLARKPEATDLCRELGLGDDLVGTKPTNTGTYILHRGRLEPLPAGTAMGAPATLGPLLRTRLLSPAGKLRAALELVLPPRRSDGDESVGHLISRRVGRQVAERLAEPLLAGVYAGDAFRLSVDATYPFLRDLERRHGSLMRGLQAARRTGPADGDRSGERSAFLTLRHGLDTLVERLREALMDVDVRTGVRPTAIEPRPPGGTRY
ncbi:MAG: protoporphyrinogen oxidase, partial [Clostridia bacterium]|nr:protoporphyrinogen oxidase [Clostridia bacterium]